MRKIFIRLIAVYVCCLFFISGIRGQVYNGSLTLSSQAEIDAFNYTSVKGPLIIQEISPGSITNLNGLSELTTVEFSLEIRSNSVITNLDGLLNLVSVGGNLQISHNSALSNLDGLSNLVSAGGLSILQNAVLSNITGLSNLSTTGGGLYIEGNGLSNLNGLSKIRSASFLSITGNGISNIDGLMNLTSVTYDVTISYNGALKNLNGFANLRRIGGHLTIQNNVQLTDFCGLYTAVSNHGILNFITATGNGAPLNICSTLSGNLTLTTQQQLDAFNFTSVTGNLAIHENATGDITNIGGLSDLTSLGGSLTVQNNPALNSFCGLYPLFNGGYAGSYSITGNAVNPTAAQIISGGTCPIFVGDITLTTQVQVDGFNYTGVTGDLVIYESSPGTITNLNALSQLTFVGGDLSFNHNTAITHLDALSNLTSIGGTLNIQQTSLANINGLSHLTTLGSLLIAFMNNSLTNIDGLSHVTILNGEIRLFANNALTNVDGLSGIKTAQHIDIVQNTALTNINGLSHLQTIIGVENVPAFGVGIMIKQNPLLTNLDGLSALSSINGMLEIEENSSLVNVDGLHNLKTVTQRLGFFGNPSLQNIDGLSNVQSFTPDNALHNVIISDNDALTNLNGLRFLQFVWQNLTVSGNALLENIDGLSHLNQATNISVVANPKLTNLNGFGNIYAANNITITFNSTLGNYCGLYNVLSHSSPAVSINSNLVNPTPAQIIAGGRCPVSLPDFILTSQAEVDAFNYTYVPASLSIREDVPGNITNLNALSQLTEIAGSLSIEANSALTNINPLMNLTSIGADIFIEQNNSLINLNGLSGLTFIGRDVYLFQNTSLQSISGLAGVSSLGRLQINGNSALTDLGLSALTTLEDLLIDNNAALPTLNGLNKLKEVKDVFAIRDNDLLTNVDALSALTFVGGDPTAITASFDINGNAVLANLDGLSNLSTVEGNLLVSGNTVLNKFCGLYKLLSTNGLGGYYRVIGNATNPTIQNVIDDGVCASSSNPVIVTINQASGQSDPTSVSPIHFTVTFSQDVTGFNGADISFTGSTASGILVASVSGGPSIYDVAVTGMTSSGYIVASIPGGAALNASSQSSLASTSTDNTVFFILNSNTCPNAGTLNLYTSAGTAINFQLSGTDADNDALTYSIGQNPLHGNATTSLTGSATYTPNSGYYGNDQFKYKVNDGTCETEATVNVTIVVCPRGAGYWKSHPESWPSSALPMLLGTRSYTKTQLLAILNIPIGNGNNADASLMMADQEISTKLNIASGSPIASGLNDSLLSADRLIGNNALPMKVKPNSALGKRMIAVAEFLSLYNNGSLTQGCHDEAALTSSKQINALGETQSSLMNGLNVKVYPNPASDYFNITINSNDTKRKIIAQVFDQYGRSIETRNANANSLIRVGDRYRPGTYFVRIIQGNEHKEIKLIKMPD